MKNISPHVNIYKFPLTAISSITNRITGLGLTGIFLLGGSFSLLNIDLNEKYKKLDPFYKSLVNYSIIFPTSYHTYGGIRHFLWDKYPSLLTNNKVAKSSYLLFGLSIGTTYLIENPPSFDNVKPCESMEILKDIFI